jgi:hypothetical protein
VSAWVYDDGGRAVAGFKGTAEDCVTRAIAIATAMDYRTVYKMVDDACALNWACRPLLSRDGSASRYGLAIEKDDYDRIVGWQRRHRRKSTAETGVYGRIARSVMARLGWDWVHTMGTGGHCHVRLRADELPTARVIAALSGHYCAVIDGVIHDTDDPSQDGTRCVYGVYSPQGNTWDGLAIEPVRDRPETGIPASFYTREEPCDPDSFVAGDSCAFWLEAGVDLIGAGVDLRVVCLDGGTFLAAGLSVEAARRVAEQLLDAAQAAATFVLPEIP